MTEQNNNINDTGFDKLSPEEFLEQTRQLAEKSANAQRLFIVKDGDEWMEIANKKQIPKMLFGEFWFESELCIFFADTNVGKSILAVQIGVAIARGHAVKGFKLETKAQPVIYFDFEMNDKQFETRYTNNFEVPFRFGRNFRRAEINPELNTGDISFEDYLMAEMEVAFVKTGAKVLIIDNITYLRNETEKAADALPLMKMLKSLKQKYGLSILVLAHTPKRDGSKPISKNDLQGSKMLINFCDSAFAVAESTHDKSVRYIKQIKARNCEIMYDSNNVAVCQIIKPDNFLHFDFMDFGFESEHLRQLTDEEKNELTARVAEILAKEPGKAPYAIARELCDDKSKLNSFSVKVSRICKRLAAREGEK